MRPLSNILQEKAAHLLVDDDLTYAQTAAALNVAERTIYNWFKSERFQARIAYLTEEFNKTVTKGFAKKKHRIRRHLQHIAAAQDKQEKLDQVIQERAAAPHLQEIPGGSTGLVVVSRYQTVKRRIPKVDAQGIAIPGQWQTVEESVPIVEVDTGTLAEYRNYQTKESESMHAIAEELGQVVAKHEVAFRPPDEMTEDELLQMAEGLEKVLGPMPVQPAVVEIIPPATHQD